MIDQYILTFSLMVASLGLIFSIILMEVITTESFIRAKRKWHIELLQIFYRNPVVLYLQMCIRKRLIPSKLELDKVYRINNKAARFYIIDGVFQIHLIYHTEGCCYKQRVLNTKYRQAAEEVINDFLIRAAGFKKILGVV